MDIADKAGAFPAIFRPGNHLKGAQVGPGNEIAFFDAGKSFNGGTVKSHSLVHRLIELSNSDRKILQVSQNIGKPALNVAHILLFDDRFNFFNVGRG